MFEKRALELFQYQHEHCFVYRKWCDALCVDSMEVTKIEQIPFLPIEFFKKENIYCGEIEPQLWFESSGTSGGETSKHYVADSQVYRSSYEDGFRKFYGEPSHWSFFGLLPMYMERPHSSLAAMIQGLQGYSRGRGGFFLNDFDALKIALERASNNNENIFIIGVTFAMVEFAQRYNVQLLDNSVVMETGGMKGKGREIERSQLHGLLSKAFGVKKIHSEYGMTELLSQAYSCGDGLFVCSDSMKVVGRDLRNPLDVVLYGEDVGLNIVDLSNKNSCSFIATGDRGKINLDGSFEVFGRITGQIERGCNMLY